MADLYKVNSINRRVRLMPTGEFIDVYEVSFTTKSGISSTVDVPVAKFSKEYVSELINAEAQKLEDVLKL